MYSITSATRNACTATTLRAAHTAARSQPRMHFHSFVRSIFPGGSTSKREVKGNGIADFAKGINMGCELQPNDPPAGCQYATFAGGCFWGPELLFQRVEGVTGTSVGYAQGHMENPTYRDVCSGNTGHTEAVRVTYDPEQVSYRHLLDVLASQTDFTQKNRQGPDRGTQYRTGVYYHNDDQKQAAEEFFKELQQEINDGKRKNWAGKEIMTELLPVDKYYIAEKEHQQYLSKGGRFGSAQSAQKGETAPIRCYG